MLSTRFINLNIILKFLGLGFVVICFFQLLTMCVSLLFNDGHHIVFLISAILSFFSGLSLIWLTRRQTYQRLTLRESFMMIIFQWIFVPVMGMVPFYLGFADFTIIDALFESFSGFTTTGFTLVFNKMEMPESFMFWKSVIQWIGGMGLIIFLIALLPFVREGEYKMFFSDLQDISFEPIHHKLTENARRLWYIYIVFTFIAAIALYFSGLNWFQAICYALSTMSTGGGIAPNGNVTHLLFPTQVVLACIMFVAGANYLQIYRFVILRTLHFKNEEFKWYLIFIFLCFFVITFTQIIELGFEQSRLFETLFNVISISSTTGIYLEQPRTHILPSVWFIFFVMMFIGSSTGSTGGGINLYRIIVLFRTMRNYINTLIHPQTYYATKFNDRMVPVSAIRRIYAFFQVFLITFILGSLALSLTGLDFIDAMVFCISSLSNVGPGAFLLSDLQTFASLTSSSKLLMSLLMVLGRIEILPALILISRSMWKK